MCVEELIDVIHSFEQDMNAEYIYTIKCGYVSRIAQSGCAFWRCILAVQSCNELGFSPYFGI